MVQAVEDGVVADVDDGGQPGRVDHALQARPGAGPRPTPPDSTAITCSTSGPSIASAR